MNEMILVLLLMPYFEQAFLMQPNRRMKYSEMI